MPPKRFGKGRKKVEAVTGEEEGLVHKNGEEEDLSLIENSEDKASVAPKVAGKRGRPTKAILSSEELNSNGEEPIESATEATSGIDPQNEKETANEDQKDEQLLSKDESTKGDGSRKRGRPAKLANASQKNAKQSSSDVEPKEMSKGGHKQKNDTLSSEQPNGNREEPIESAMEAASENDLQNEKETAGEDQKDEQLLTEDESMKGNGSRKRGRPAKLGNSAETADEDQKDEQLLTEDESMKGNGSRKRGRPAKLGNASQKNAKQSSSDVVDTEPKGIVSKRGRKQENIVMDKDFKSLLGNTSVTVSLFRQKKVDNMARELMKDTEVAIKAAASASSSKGKRGREDGDDSRPGKVSKNASSTSAKEAREKIPDVSALDFDNKSANANGESWNLKIVSWNINGIRAWLEKDGVSYLHRENPDIVCFQETKCSESKLPAEANVEGFHCYWLGGDKDGYSGVGLLSRQKPASVDYGIGKEDHDSEGRVITADYDKFYLVAAYVPNSGRGLVRLDYRQKWDTDFRAYLKKLDEIKPVILCGDLNVAHQEIDLAKPKSNKRNAGFTQEERDGFSALLSEGFVDTYRHLYPDATGVYTFWTYMMKAREKNIGWRLDYFVMSEKIMEQLCDCCIRKDVMGSDHCPLVLFLCV